MKPQNILQALKQGWILVAGSVILCVVIAAAYFVVKPATYTAETQLYVSSQSGDNPLQAFSGAQLSEQRIASYAELAKSSRVTGEVVEKLGLPDTADELAAKISASSTAGSVVLNLAATDRSPETAAAIANSVAETFSALVNEIERPIDARGFAPVAIRIVERAAPPLAPSSPGLAPLLLLGAVVGLALGIAAALLRFTLDRTIKSVDELAETTTLPNLAAVPLKRGAVATRPTLEPAHSLDSEAYRQLRTNLLFTSVDRNVRTIVVTSSIPGEGKSTTTINLAAAFAASGSRTLIIDADLRRPSVGRAFELENSVGLTTVLTGQVPLRQAIQRVPQAAFEVLVSGRTPPNPSEMLASDQMQKLLREASGWYDFIIIDTPPLLPVADTSALAAQADGVLLVSAFRKVTTQQISSAAGALRSISANCLGTVLSMVTEGVLRSYGTYAPSYAPSAPSPPPDHSLADVRVPNPSPRPGP